MNAWTYLILAGCFEIGFTTMMKLSEGFTKPVFTIGFLICATTSFFLLNKSLTGVPLGTGYAVWTGIGAFGTALIGILVFKDPSSLPRVFFLTTLIGSIIGLKVFA